MKQLMRILAGCLLAILPAVSTLGAESSQGPSFPRIANVYGTALSHDGWRFHGDRRTPGEVARYDLLIGVQRRQQKDTDGAVFRKHLEELKKLNPHLIAVHFACSAPYTHVAPPEEVLAARNAGRVFPWLLQADGKLIAGWPGTYMVNLAVPEVVEWLAQQTVPAVKTIGYDGVFIDCMGPHFDSWACEIATGKPYTVDFDADGNDDDRDVLAEVWTKAKTDLAERTRELIGADAVFMANQAGPDTFGQLNGIYLEDYLDAVLDRGMSWEQVLEKYLRWTETPQRPNVTVLGCGSGVEPPFQAFRLSTDEQASYLERGRQRLQRMRFGLVTALMGDGYYSYDLHTRWRGQYWWYPEFDAPLGYPTGSCARSADGTWQRGFEGGLVIVNPTDWDVSVELEKSFRDVSSDRVARRFVIPRLDGRIYLLSHEPARPGTLSPVEPLLTATGPAGVVAREDTLVLRDGKGTAVLIGQSDSIESLCVRGQELIDLIAPVVVTDDRWRNFDTEGLQHDIGADGTLTLRGRRRYEQQTLEFTQKLRMAEGRLALEYHWRAATPLQLRAFRQSVRLMPRVFGGKMLYAGGREILLPAEVAKDPNLGNKIISATLPVADDASITIRLPQDAQLIDDRCYNGSGYLLAFYPIGGDILEGREWSYSIEICYEQEHAFGAR